METEMKLNYHGADQKGEGSSVTSLLFQLCQDKALQCLIFVFYKADIMCGISQCYCTSVTQNRYKLADAL